MIWIYKNFKLNSRSEKIRVNLFIVRKQTILD